MEVTQDVTIKDVLRADAPVTLAGPILSILEAYETYGNSMKAYGDREGFMRACRALSDMNQRDLADKLYELIDTAKENSANPPHSGLHIISCILSKHRHTWRTAPRVSWGIRRDNGKSSQQG